MDDVAKRWKEGTLEHVQVRGPPPNECREEDREALPGRRVILSVGAEVGEDQRNQHGTFDGRPSLAEAPDSEELGEALCGDGADRAACVAEKGEEFWEY